MENQVSPYVTYLFNCKYNYGNIFSFLHFFSIRQLLSGGLFSYWKFRALEKYKSSLHIKPGENQNEEFEEASSLFQLQSAFYVLPIGLFCALIMNLIETLQCLRSKCLTLNKVGRSYPQSRVRSCSASNPKISLKLTLGTRPSTCRI